MSQFLSSPTCRSCGSSNTQTFYEIGEVPVNSVLLLSTRREAVGLPTGHIELRFCDHCGFIFNALFDLSLVEYSPRCEETQGHSPSFRNWHESLARRLVERYNLRNREILEIGCGKGEFLDLLCTLGGNRGVGFDPAYVEERSIASRNSRVEFIPLKYPPESLRHSADFLCCKMTLEHIHDPAEFIDRVCRSLDKLRDTVVFLQVPNTMKILSDLAFWDVYYEHCSYYTGGSLRRLLMERGFEILDTGLEYADQYLTIEARLSKQPARFTTDMPDDLPGLRKAVSRFAEGVPAWLAHWHHQLRDYRERNLRVVVWGSGSKGVAFLTAVDLDGFIEYVVDINPHRQGHYMAKTGQKIVAPDFLRQYSPNVVLVMNAFYRLEIAVEMKRHGVEAQIVTM